MVEVPVRRGAGCQQLVGAALAVLLVAALPAMVLGIPAATDAWSAWLQHREKLQVPPHRLQVVSPNGERSLILEATDARTAIWDCEPKIGMMRLIYSSDAPPIPGPPLERRAPRQGALGE